MDSHSASPLYLLERFDVGVVQLDLELKVVAMNSFARRVLPVEDKQPFEKVVLSFHPERSQPKVRFLLDQAECPVSNPPPMTMIMCMRGSFARGQGPAPTIRDRASLRRVAAVDEDRLAGDPPAVADQEADEGHDVGSVGETGWRER